MLASFSTLRKKQIEITKAEKDGKKDRNLMEKDLGLH